ncbi:hypothetical protein [Microbacterium hibisci]|uniref:hypothetical protein n=1 Tax=Microbacterium hibisci TaxID=2036000 RepID=UPI00194136F3|nr:hypothetical protein [Microbacterium hibisci]
MSDAGIGHPLPSVDDHRSTQRSARASTLFALPFAIASLLVVFGLAGLGFEVETLLGVVLAGTVFVPALVEIVLRTSIPRALQLHYLIFIVAGPLAGSVLHVYSAIPRWDAYVHFDSGVMLAWLGMLAVRRAEERAGVPLPVWFGLTIVMAIPMAFAGAWEISEFVSDVVLGTTSQSGLEDTMFDIVAGTAGGLLAIALLMVARRPRTVAPLSLLRGGRRR